MKPLFVGKEISAEREVEKVVVKCSNTKEGEYFTCMRNSVAELLKEHTPKSIMLAIEKVSQDEKYKDKVPCHDFGHVVGEEAAEVEDDLGSLITQCGRNCGYGCVHGSVLGYVKKDPALLNELGGVCEFQKTAFPRQDITACNHGLGHGLAEYASYDLKNSLSLCNGLEKTIEKEECATGVFMEIYDTPTLSHELKTFPEDPVSLCENLEAPYDEVCFRNSASYVYKETADIKKAESLCKNLEGDLKRQCFVSLGSDFYFLEGGRFRDIKENCFSLNDNEDIKACIDGVLISSLVDDGVGEWGDVFCRGLDGEFESLCGDLLDKNMSLSKKEQV